MDAPQRSTGPGGRLALSVLTYTLARFALVIVIAVAIYVIGKLVGVNVPWIVAALFAIIIALPLGMIVFRGLRQRVNRGITEVDERRREQRDDLRARLHGDEHAGDDETPKGK